MYTCRIYSIIDVASLLYNWKLKITLRIYMGLYHNRNNRRETTECYCGNCCGMTLLEKYN